MTTLLESFYDGPIFFQTLLSSSSSSSSLSRSITFILFQILGATQQATLIYRVRIENLLCEKENEEYESQIKINHSYNIIPHHNTRSNTRLSVHTSMVYFS